MNGGVLVVVACAAAKRKYPAPAAALYCSNHFAFMLSAARSEAADTTRVCGKPAGVAIVSALHGLVDLDTVIGPYDLKMGQPGAWGPDLLAAQLCARRPDEIIAMLPAAYLKALSAGVHIVNEAGKRTLSSWTLSRPHLASDISAAWRHRCSATPAASERLRWPALK